MSKRMLLQKSSAEWVHKLRGVRRSLRDSSWCTWTPAEHKQPDRPVSDAAVEVITAMMTSDATSDGASPDSTSTADAAREAARAEAARSCGGALCGGLPLKRKRAPKKCQRCLQVVNYAPRSRQITAEERKSQYHSKFGWCPVEQDFSAGSRCGKCGCIRSKDDHGFDGSCSRSQQGGTGL